MIMKKKSIIPHIESEIENSNVLFEFVENTKKGVYSDNANTFEVFNISSKEVEEQIFEVSESCNDIEYSNVLFGISN